MISLRRPLCLATSALVALSLVACGEGKVAQCKKLINVVNKGEAIAKGMNDKPDAATMKKLSTDLTGLAKDIEGVQLVDEPLKGFQGRFVTIYTDLGQAAGKVGGALNELAKLKKPDAATLAKSKDLKAQVESASKTGDKAAKDEGKLVEEVNKYCGAK